MTDEMRVREALRRAEAIRQRRSRMIDRMLASGSAVSGVLTLLLIVLLSGGRSCSVQTGYYGSTQMFEGAGGYVLVAVAAFVAAAAITLFCVHYRERKEKNEADKKDKYDEGR